MMLKRVQIRNFRAVRDAAVDFGRQTAILGANGTGKSTILRAIERFYASSTSVELDDFFGRRTEEPIEIALTFCRFSSDEIERFGTRIQNDEMTVVRIFEAGGSRNNGRYYGSTPQNADFAAVRNASSANEKRKAYGELLETFPQYALATVKRADEIEPHLQAWEQAMPFRTAQIAT